VSDTVRGIAIRLGAAIGDSRCKSIIESELLSAFFLPEMGIGIFITECFWLNVVASFTGGSCRRFCG